MNHGKAGGVAASCCAAFDMPIRKRKYNIGFNTAVSARYLDSLDYPSLTFETDSYGGEARDPVFMDPKDPFSILTTNTFYQYSGANAKAVSLAKEDLEKKILEASYGTFVAYDFDEVFDRGR